MWKGLSLVLREGVERQDDFAWAGRERGREERETAALCAVAERGREKI